MLFVVACASFISYGFYVSWINIKQDEKKVWKEKCAFEAGKHISSFYSLRTCSYEKHIIYVFVLFSHNFIINVYHHYCSYSISHCSSCCQMKKFSFPSFAFFCWRVNEKHQKIWVMRNTEDGGKKKPKRNFLFLEIFAFQKDIFWYEEALRSFPWAAFSSSDIWLFICRPINWHLVW